MSENTGTGVARAERVSAPGAVTVLRYVTAIAVLISGLLHLQQYFAGFDSESLIGPLFLLNAAGGIVLFVLVLMWRHPLATFLAAGFGLVTVVVYWIAVTAGFFGFHETQPGGWAEILGQIVEYVALIAGLAATWMLLAARRTPGS